MGNENNEKIEEFEEELMNVNALIDEVKNFGKETLSNKKKIIEEIFPSKAEREEIYNNIVELINALLTEVSHQDLSQEEAEELKEIIDVLQTILEAINLSLFVPSSSEQTHKDFVDGQIALNTPINGEGKKIKYSFKLKNNQKKNVHPPLKVKKNEIFKAKKPSNEPNVQNFSSQKIM